MALKALKSLNSEITLDTTARSNPLSEPDQTKCIEAWRLKRQKDLSNLKGNLEDKRLKSQFTTSAKSFHESCRRKSKYHVLTAAERDEWRQAAQLDVHVLFPDVRDVVEQQLDKWNADSNEEGGSAAAEVQDEQQQQQLIQAGFETIVSNEDEKIRFLRTCFVSIAHSAVGELGAAVVQRWCGALDLVRQFYSTAAAEGERLKTDPKIASANGGQRTTPTEVCCCILQQSIVQRWKQLLLDLSILAVVVDGGSLATSSSSQQQHGGGGTNLVGSILWKKRRDVIDWCYSGINSNENAKRESYHAQLRLALSAETDVTYDEYTQDFELSEIHKHKFMKATPLEGLLDEDALQLLEAFDESTGALLGSKQCKEEKDRVVNDDKCDDRLLDVMKRLCKRKHTLTALHVAFSTACGAAAAALLPSSADSNDDGPYSSPNLSLKAADLLCSLVSELHDDKVANDMVLEVSVHILVKWVVATVGVAGGSQQHHRDEMVEEVTSLCLHMASKMKSNTVLGCVAQSDLLEGVLSPLTKGFEAQAQAATEAGRHQQQQQQQLQQLRFSWFAVGRCHAVIGRHLMCLRKTLSFKMLDANNNNGIGGEEDGDDDENIKKKRKKRKTLGSLVTVAEEVEQYDLAADVVQDLLGSAQEHLNAAVNCFMSSMEKDVGDVARAPAAECAEALQLATALMVASTASSTTPFTVTVAQQQREVGGIVGSSIGSVRTMFEDLLHKTMKYNAKRTNSAVELELARVRRAWETTEALLPPCAPNCAGPAKLCAALRTGEKVTRIFRKRKSNSNGNDAPPLPSVDADVDVAAKVEVAEGDDALPAKRKKEE